MLTKKLFPHLKSLRLDNVTIDGGHVIFEVSATGMSGRCPLCGRHSRRLHSHYRRTVADRPISGRPVVLSIHVRRFVCLTVSCPRRIFAERLPDLVAPYAQRSYGLTAALQDIGVVTGGEVGARVAARLGMCASPDTLLRVIRALPDPEEGHLRIIGIDDWAWRKGRRYGSVVVDHERHRIADLLPDRDANTMAAWLAARPHLAVISRDRSGLYADAARRGAPQARQVADRFHIVDNLVEALEEVLLPMRSTLKETAAQVAAALATEAAIPSCAGAMYRGKPKTARQGWARRLEEKSQQRLARRVAAYDAVRALHTTGVGVTDIARRVGLSRQGVYDYLRRAAPPERRHSSRQYPRTLAPYEPYLLERWQEGGQTGTQLWQEIRALGYAGSRSTLTRFLARLRCQGHPPRSRGSRRSSLTSARGPAAREVAFLFVRRPDAYDEEQEAYVTRLRRHDLALATAYTLTQDFVRMMRDRRGDGLEGWIATAVDSGIAPLSRFATGLQDDYAAVMAGLSTNYSNGPTEGQITKIKALRRAMYGRGRFDLVRQRVLHAA